MNDPKLTTSPALTCTHLVWVPGRQTMPSNPGSAASSPAICVSSPRITSAGLLLLQPRQDPHREPRVRDLRPREGDGTGGQGTAA